MRFLCRKSQSLAESIPNFVIKRLKESTQSFKDKINTNGSE